MNATYPSLPVTMDVRRLRCHTLCIARYHSKKALFWGCDINVDKPGSYANLMRQVSRTKRNQFLHAAKAIKHLPQ